MEVMQPAHALHCEGCGTEKPPLYQLSKGKFGEWKFICGDCYGKINTQIEKMEANGECLHVKVLGQIIGDKQQWICKNCKLTGEDESEYARLMRERKG